MKTEAANTLKSDLKLVKGLTLWLTGLSGSGKSTVAENLAKKLKESNPDFPLEVIDGDEIRKHVCKDLGFTREDRLINVERIAYIAGVISKHGILTIVPVIAPYKEAREKARSLSENFAEVYIKASIETVKDRDVKGLYEKAIKGEIKNFTGISDPYDEPENPELVLNTEEENIEESISKLIDFLNKNNFIEM